MPADNAAKVYLVWQLDYEAQDVLSVWTTREAAEAEVERVRPSAPGLWYEVMEFTLDERWEP